MITPKSPERKGRKPFINRPWIMGKLYDDLARKSILHCDVQTLSTGAMHFLMIDWRRAGRERVALDAYMIEPDGLTPLWDASLPVKLSARVIRWGDVDVPWNALHARVCEQAATAADAGQWARVSLLAHYVPALDIDAEIIA